MRNHRETVRIEHKNSARLSIWTTIALVLAGCFWGTGFFFGKIAFREMTVVENVSFRLLFGSIILVPVQVKRWQRIRGRDLWLLAATSVVGVPVQFLVQFKGLQLTTVSHASLIVGSAPVLLALNSALFLHERFREVGVAAPSSLGRRSPADCVFARDCWPAPAHSLGGYFGAGFPFCGGCNDSLDEEPGRPIRFAFYHCIFHYLRDPAAADFCRNVAAAAFSFFHGGLGCSGGTRTTGNGRSVSSVELGPATRARIQGGGIPQSRAARGGPGRNYLAARRTRRESHSRRLFHHCIRNLFQRPIARRRQFVTGDHPKLNGFLPCAVPSVPHRSLQQDRRPPQCYL
jgi:uncharacterized membrane protein